MKWSRWRIFFCPIEVVDLETEMIEARHQPTVSHHVPGADHQVNFAVGQIETVAAAEILHWLEFKDFLIEFGDMSGPTAADRDMIDPARLLPAFVQIALAHVGHALL